MGEPVSEATLFENAVPDGWYDDPAKAGMQRWWSGTDWTDHVRYADMNRPRAVVSPVIEPIAEAVAVEPVAPVQQYLAPVAYLPERLPVAPVAPVPYFAPIAQTSYEGPSPLLVPTMTSPAPTFDDYYVPMARFQPGSSTGVQLMSSKRRSAGLGALAIVALAVLGAGIGVALWIFLPN